MVIEQINLQYFRNIDNLKLKLHSDVNIFYGQNAMGKTSILEAIYMAATGRSERTGNDRELINFKHDAAHIQLFIKKESRADRIDVHLKRNEKKGIAINGIPIKKLGELFGLLHVVLFSPEDLRLLKSGPLERRRFIDLEICQLSSVYYHNLQQYHKILKQRNNLLKSIQRSKPYDKQLEDTLFAWDEQLVSFGNNIIAKRDEYIKAICEYAQQKHYEITNHSEELLVVYKPNTTADIFMNKLQRNRERDIINGITSVGPHKDDIDFFINGEDAKIYGSQGQQRTVALSLKLSEIDLIYKTTHTMPVLLLDDVLSELDSSRQRHLLENIGEIQIIITCTGIAEVMQKYKSRGRLFFVEAGEIKES